MSSLPVGWRLPTGWKMMPFGEVATLQRGYDLPVQDRQEGLIKIFAANGPVGTHNVHQVRGPGVVTGRSGSIGKVHYVDEDFWPLNTALWVKDFHGNDPRWVSRILTWMDLEQYTRGVGVPTLNRNLVHEVSIPLPPLDEQKRIAAILDQADALLRLRTRALDRLNALGQAIFHEMFGDREYPKRMLKDVGRVTTGGTPPTAEDRYYGSDVPFMTPGDLNSGTAAKRYLSRSGAEVVRTVDAGAALVCCIGATIGKMDMARATVAFNQQVNAVTWGSEVAPSYGLFALGIVRPEIERQGRGASTTLPILKKSSFEKIEIVLPPFDKQLSFSAKIDLLEGQTSRTRNEIFTLDALFTSLQHRAFQGEL